MTDPCELWRELIGVHAVGQLGEDDERALRAHVEGCEGCRDELVELEEVALALSLADPSRVAGEDPPRDLEQRVVGRVRRARRAERRSLWSRRLAPPLAAGVAAAAVTAIAFVLVDRSPPAPPTEPVAFAQPPAGVSAEGKLIAHTWGVEVNLVLTGLRAGERYTVMLMRKNGTMASAGTFIGVSNRPIVCKMNGAVLRENATGLAITGADGAVVLRGSFT